jgi:hypothetical protein
VILYAVGVLLAALLVLAGAAWIVRQMLRASEEGPPPRWAVLVAAGVLLAVPVGALAAYFAVPAPVSERGLTNSIERETGSAGLGSECSEVRNGRCITIRDAAGLWDVVTGG